MANDQALKQALYEKADEIRATIRLGAQEASRRGVKPDANSKQHLETARDILYRADVLLSEARDLVDAVIEQDT